MISSTNPHPASFVGSLLHQTEGPLTRELLLQPSGFGLGQMPSRLHPDATTTSVCGFCSTGCNLNIHMKDGAAIGLSPTTDYPVNLGMACPKGWEALRVLDSPDRATVPLLKSARGKLEPVSWETALSTFVTRMKQIQQKSGPESIAWLGTGQIATEELAYLGALSKFGMGMIHGDGNTRQCMATAVVSYKQSFGFDAPPYTYQDFEESDVIILVGANLCIAHPILWERVVRNRRQPKIIVIDPRRTETAMQGTHHLAIKPKSDLVLFYGIANLLIERGWVDAEFIERSTTGYTDFVAHVAPYTLDVVTERTGISAAAIEEVAEIIHRSERSSFWWTMGVNQSYEGVRTAQSLINLALMTGNIGRPGTGANSITGQCNAMGSRLFSNTTGLLGGREFTNPQHRAEVAQILNIPESRIPDRNSQSYHEILKGILDGKIKGLWVIATNPAHSWINQDQARDILSRLEFLVVQDMYQSTETARVADLVLPAAAWGEKTGTFINSERRIGSIKKLARAPGQALSDFSIFRAIAQAWGCGEMFQEWSSPEAVFRIMQRLSVGRPCDFSGIDGYSHLDQAGGVQWPYPQENPSDEQQRRLFADGCFHHPDGKAKFLFEDPRPMPEPVNKDYPLLLLTGRGTAVQWHTQTRTAKSDVLRKLAPERVYVEVNPQDARTLGLKPQDQVYLESRRATIRVHVFVTPTVAAGQVFVPMHYPEANRLTDAVFDPYSKQPSYKACAVRLRRLS